MRRSDCKALAAAACAGRRRPRTRLCAALPAGLALILAAGCSGPILTFQAEADVAPGEPASTGSIAKAPTSFGRDLGDEDWRRAHAALGVALDPQGNGRPVKWDNPESGLRGSVNPTSLPFVSRDEVCRDFLASIVTPEGGRFLRGTGCKPSGGTWELRRLKASRTADAKG